MTALTELSTVPAAFISVTQSADGVGDNGNANIIPQTASQPVSVVKLYPEEYSCNMYRIFIDIRKFIQDQMIVNSCDASLSASAM